MDKITGIVLVGGQSSRMGQNKALLPYKHHTFIEKIIASVRFLDEVLLVANDPTPYEHLGVKIVKDIYPKCGPMSGIHAGLTAASHSWCFVLPCDMPYISQEVIRYIASYKYGHNDAVLTRTCEGKIHPLLGLYHKKSLHFFEKSLAQKKYKLIRLLERMNTKYIDIEKGGFDVNKVVDNINTPDDYQRLHSQLKPPVIAISGVSNSGKTTVMVKLISKLKKKGYTVGTIKHDGHEFQMDHQGKDTYRHAEAGADGVIIVSRNQYAMIQKTPHRQIPLEHLIELHNQYDIILLEGFKSCSYPKVEVVREARSRENVCDCNTLLVVVTDVQMNMGDIPTLLLQDTDGLLHIIEKHIKERHHSE